MTPVEALAARMLDAVATEEQCVRRIPDDAEAEALRVAIRALAKARGVRIRTARMDGTVVAVRLDAAVWHEDAATMRRKLAPEDRPARGSAERGRRAGGERSPSGVSGEDC